jgi:hypothetical protein
MVRTSVDSSMRSAEIFSARTLDSEIDQDRSEPLITFARANVSELARSDRSRSDRRSIELAEKFPRASNEVRDRSERSKIVRRC